MENRMNRWVALLLAAMSSPGVTAGEVPSSLPAVVDRVLRMSPGLESTRNRILEAEAGRKEVNAHRWPMLEAKASVIRSDNPVYVFGSLLEQGRFGQQNFAIPSLNNADYLTNYKSSLSLGVPLFTAFELSSQAKIADLGRQQAESGSESASQNLRFQVVMNYLQVLASRQILSQVEDRITSSSKEIEDAKRLRQQGLVLGSDYYVAEAIREGLRGWKVQVQNDLSQAEERLAILAKEPVKIPAGRLSEKAYEVESDRTLIDRALRDRPELRAARLEESAAETARRQAASSLLPRADAFASVETNTNDFNSNPSNRLVGVRMNVPLGDPAYFPRRARAAAGEAAQRKRVESLEQLVHLEVAAALRDSQTALEGLAAAKEIRDRSSKALELFGPLYRSGRQSVMEVLRAEEGLARAEAAYAQALFGMHLGWARLKLATGHLDRETVSEIASKIEASSPLMGEDKDGGEKHDR
jgi:outer membrane protein